MSGKWHVGGDLSARDIDTWRLGELEHPTPRQRGFDKFFGILDGAASFFSPHGLFEDETRLFDLPDGFYFTDAITDKAIGMIGEAVAEDDPFFLYLAHTAPHWPLHAPAEDIARYEGVYTKGWDAIRTARHEELNGSGTLRSAWDISPRDETVPPWQAATHPDWEAGKMAAYAAMVDRVDQSIGRLIVELKRLSVFDDTLILFLSDNGGCAEFMAEDGWAQYYPDLTHDGRAVRMGNVPDLMPGADTTFQSYDKPWANVSNAPFRLYKHYVHEGGISTPLVAHWPSKLPGNVIGHEACHVVDILPTILEATGCAYPKELGGHDIQPMEGESLIPFLAGAEWVREAPIFFEHEGNCAIRHGAFKLVRQHGGPWELYDMDADRTELHDLAGRNAPLEAELIGAYTSWAARCGIEDWERLQPKLLAAWELDSVEG